MKQRFFRATLVSFCAVVFSAIALSGAAGARQRQPLPQLGGVGTETADCLVLPHRHLGAGGGDA